MNEKIAHSLKATANWLLLCCSIKPDFQPYPSNARSVCNARFYARFTHATQGKGKGKRRFV